MVTTAVLGLPRLGPDRELKRALEAFWRGELLAADLERVGRELRRSHLRAAVAAGVDVLPSNDSSLYDHVLDMAVMVGAIPPRFQRLGLPRLERLFALARGGREAKPLEMTKWLDTNYHYLVPEVGARTRFEPDASKAVGELEDALAWGIPTRPVLLGPVSFLLLAKPDDPELRPLALLDALLDVYAHLLAELRAAGATAVQIDEPCLVGDRTDAELAAVECAWERLAVASPGLELTLATYFGGLGGAAARVLRLPAAEFHLDLVRAPEQLAGALDALAPHARLSLGVIDGRNVWAADLDALLALVEPAVERLGADRVRLAPSCSLLHVPYAAAREQRLDSELRSWLAFGDEKLAELQTLKRVLHADLATRDELLAPSRRVRASRSGSPRVHDPAVAGRVAGLRAGDHERPSPHRVRAALHADRLGLPELPTTTIGSFPQTEEIRAARRRLGQGTLSVEGYDRFLEREITTMIERQDRLGLDVLVHGEPERNDMVEYFAERLEGFAVTEHGWVQSYGSRAVKPPLLFGDVSRPVPMTVRWWRYAQDRTERPVKGMLTGPVTILKWSFVRDDQPAEQTCRQIALAIRDEARDLERAGAAVIQVDEAALREGLPLRNEQQPAYLRWAIDCFRLVAGALADETQVHSHMCYSDFGGFIEEIARMDADVLSIEASRAEVDLLDAVDDAAYPNQLGPGVYDIHSARIPSVQEIEGLLEQAEQRISRERLWVNPDCGLKTRRWEEVVPALEHLVQAAKRRRAAPPMRG